MTFYVGISGWRYPPWRGILYPPKLPQRLELNYASRLFNTIEINGSFYSLQRPEYFKAWHDDTPDDFVFAVKGPRFITHMKRLKEIEEPLANFFASGVLALEKKLGPILWQFPERFTYDENRFAAFFKLLPKTRAEAAMLVKKRGQRMKGRSYVSPKTKGALRHAVEIRHSSFVKKSFFDLLKRHRIAMVTADTAGKWPLVEQLTADFVYLRLHGDEELYASGYTDKALKKWAKKIQSWTGQKRDAYVYFDNDVKVHAPFDAHFLASLLGVENSEWTRHQLGRMPHKIIDEKPRTDWPGYGKIKVGE